MLNKVNTHLRKLREPAAGITTGGDQDFWISLTRICILIIHVGARHLNEIVKTDTNVRNDGSSEESTGCVLATTKVIDDLASLKHDTHT